MFIEVWGSGGNVFAVQSVPHILARIVGGPRPSSCVTSTGNRSGRRNATIRKYSWHFSPFTPLNIEAKYEREDELTVLEFVILCSNRRFKTSGCIAENVFRGVVKWQICFCSRTENLTFHSQYPDDRWLYNWTSLFRTRLIRSPRYFEVKPNPLGLSVIWC